MSDIVNLLREIADKWIGNDSSKVESFFYRMERFYELNRRHQYSEITAFVYDKKVSDEGMDILSNNLIAIRSFASKNDYPDIADKLDKIYDHIQLAIYQKNMFEDIYSNVMKMNAAHLTNLQEEAARLKDLTARTETDVRNIGKQINSQRQNIEKNEDEMESLRTDLKDLQGKETSILTQFVTILGIFASIMFAAFGGFQIITSTIGQLDKELRVGMLMIFSSMIMIGIVSLLYILLNGIAKLTGKDFDACNCKELGKPCNHQFHQRHPAFTTVLLTLLYFFTIGLSAYVINYGQLFASIKNIKVYHFGKVAQFIGLTIVIIWPVILFLAFRCITKRRDKNVTEVDGHTTLHGAKDPQVAASVHEEDNEN